MFSCQSIQNIFVEIMKLKFGQDFEIEILFKLEFKKLGKMTQASCCWAGEPVKNYLAVFFSLRGVVWWGYPFALCINNPKYQPVSLYYSSFRNIQLSQLDLFSSSIYQNIQNSKMCYISNLICGTFIYQYVRHYFLWDFCYKLFQKRSSQQSKESQCHSEWKIQWRVPSCHQ